jgi:hypothetical protein
MLFFSPFIFGITSFFTTRNIKNKHATHHPFCIYHINLAVFPTVFSSMNGFTIHFIGVGCYLLHHLSSSINIKQNALTNGPSSLFIIYYFSCIFFNLIHVYYIYIDVLPITSLGVLPTIFFGSSTITLPSPLHLLDILHASPSVLPSIHPFSSNYDKLCYLTARQSTMATNTKLLKFSSEHAVCIDTGASCSISNLLTASPQSMLVSRCLFAILGVTIAATSSSKLGILFGTLLANMLKGLLIVVIQ